MTRFAILLIFCFATATPSFGNYDASHKLFSQELHKYVDGNLVHYQRWQQSRQNLQHYLSAIGDIDPDEFKALPDNEKEALWLNVYNAFTILLVLDNYPIQGKNKYFPGDSIRQIDGFWEKFQTKVAGESYTIDRMWHDILRRDFRDERIHFAANCAAKGSGELGDTAFVAKSLDQQLDQCLHKFLSDKNNVNFDFDAKTVTVSQIFKWFPLDFTAAAGLCKKRLPPPTDDEIVFSYIATHSAPDVQARLGDRAQWSKYKVLYRSFDWALNDADVAQK